MLLKEMRQFRSVRAIGALFLLSGLFALGVAWGAEHFLHLVPCELCLWERKPWRVLAALGALTLVLSPRWARWPVMAGLVCLLVSLVLSGIHIGVEEGLWGSPAPQCHAAAVEAPSFESWMNHLPAKPTKPCDLPDYPLGLPISLTILSGIYTLLVSVLAVVGTIGLFRRENHVRSKAQSGAHNS